jgi:spermidine/putrescine transport system substrate-binding protein
MFKRLLVVLIILLFVAACAPAASPTTAPSSSTEEVTEAADAATEEASSEATPTPEIVPPSSGVSEESADSQAADDTVAEEELAPARGTQQELQEYTGWTCPEAVRGGTLNVYNWSTYVAPDTISNFEVLCEATVVYDIYDGNESLLARLRQGNPGYDIAVPTDYAVAIMITEGLVEPLDFANIPNFANVSTNLKNPPSDPESRYSVPYQWGTIGIGYNTTTVTEAPTSWNDMFTFEGNVAWLEDTRGVMGIALIMLGFDPNTTDAAEIEQARDFLATRGTNVRYIAGDDGQALLERGEVDMTIEYNGDIFQLIDSCECDTYAYVVPNEGSQIWVDNLVIPVDAPNKALAEAFIDYILAPRVGADLSNFTAYASPNQAAIDQALIEADLLSNTAIYPPAETLSNLFFINEVPADVAALYNDAWDQIKIMIGG